MPSATVRTVEGFRVEAVSSGHTATLDEYQSLGGTGLGMTPMEAMLSALAGCAVITMTMYARRKGWPLEGATVTATLEPPASPADPRRIVQTIALEGTLDDEQRARLKEIAGKCPVHKVIAGPTVLEERFA